MRLPDFLKRIAAKEQLFVKDRRKVDGDQLDPRKAVAGHVAKARGEQDQSVGGADEQDCGSASDQKLARGQTRRNEDTEVPRGVLEDRDRSERRHADTQQRHPLVKKRADRFGRETRDEERREVKRHEQAERGDDLREAAGLVCLDAILPREMRLAGSATVSCQSTDKSVCATPALPCISGCERRHDGIAQTLLSVLVKLGSADQHTRQQKRRPRGRRSIVPHVRFYCAASTMMPMFLAPLARAMSRNFIVAS